MSHTKNFYVAQGGFKTGSSTGSIIVATSQGQLYQLNEAITVSAANINRPFNIVSLTEFGAIGDGITDNTTALNDFFGYLAQNGGIGFIPSGEYKTNDRVGYLTEGSKPFSVIGAGINVTKIVRGSDFTASVIEFRYLEDCYFEGFSIIGNNSLYPNGNHGGVWYNCKNVDIVNVEAYDVKNTCLIAYSSDATIYNNFKFIRCRADTGQVGILIVDMYYSHIIDCESINITGSPGYGLELKNDCKYCSISGTARDCDYGVALGQSNSTSASYSHIGKLFITGSNKSSLIMGYGKYNNLNDIMIIGSTNNLTSAAIRLEYSSYNKGGNIRVINMSTSAQSFQIIGDSSTVNNKFKFSKINNPGMRIAQFSTTIGGNNLVIVEDYSDPQGGVTSNVVTGNSTTGNNVVIMMGGVVNISTNYNTITHNLKYVVPPQYLKVITNSSTPVAWSITSNTANAFTITFSTDINANVYWQISE